MTLPSLVGLLPSKSRRYLATAIYGLAGGGIAVLFHWAIHFIDDNTLRHWAAEGGPKMIWGSLGVMLSAALVAGWLVNQRFPAAAGSGIPQLKLAFWKDFGWINPHIIWVKFFASAISVGGGMSLGREGPSVQLAGATSSWLASRLGLAKQKHRMPCAAGAAAGLAAAFNTPLAAVTFVLEEIIGDLNSRFLGNVLMASVLGALVAHGLLGPEPAFRMNVPDEPGWEVYVLAPWAAAVATLVGFFFQWSSLRLRAWTLTLKRIPKWALPSIGVIPAWGLGIAVWKSTGHLGVFGLGYDDLSNALSGHLAWKLAALILGAKLLATVLCYGFGGCGGIFSPTLLFGGMAGLAAAGIGGWVLPVHGSDQTVLAVVGMCACLGAVVRAPVTGILIVFEMTHQFSLVLPLMLGTLVSQSLSRLLTRENFYDALLEQDGHHLTRLIPPRDLESWQQLPVATIANFQPAALTDLTASSLQKCFDDYPFSYFPYVENGRVKGIVSRQDLELALLQREAVKVVEASVADPQESIRAIQMRLIESGTGMIVLCDAKGTLLGVVTLHDLLRAQLAYGEKSTPWEG